jgi:hypothetical protein
MNLIEEVENSHIFSQVEQIQFNLNDYASPGGGLLFGALSPLDGQISTNQN